MVKKGALRCGSCAPYKIYRSAAAATAAATAAAAVSVLDYLAGMTAGSE